MKKYILGLSALTIALSSCGQQQLSTAAEEETVSALGGGSQCHYATFIPNGESEQRINADRHDYYKVPYQSLLPYWQRTYVKVRFDSSPSGYNSLRAYSNSDCTSQTSAQASSTLNKSVRVSSNYRVKVYGTANRRYHIQVVRRPFWPILELDRFRHILREHPPIRIPDHCLVDGCGPFEWLDPRILEEQIKPSEDWLDHHVGFRVFKPSKHSMMIKGKGLQAFVMNLDGKVMLKAESKNGKMILPTEKLLQYSKQARYVTTDKNDKDKKVNLKGQYVLLLARSEKEKGWDNKKPLPVRKFIISSGRKDK